MIRRGRGKRSYVTAGVVTPMPCPTEAWRGFSLASTELAVQFQNYPHTAGKLDVL
jgi:hypothetical protein